MFSFIKWFGSLMEKAKKKKGLWFTLLTSFSLLGIFVSLYFVNFLVLDVAHKTYMNQKDHYALTFKNKINTENAYTTAIALTVSKNKDLANDFFAKDENATQRIAAKSKAIEDILNETEADHSIHISFKQIPNRQKSIGITVKKSGTVFSSAIPMIDNNGTITAVEVDKDINTLVQNYQKEHKEFAFFLSESGMHKLDPDIKKHFYTSYHDKYYVQTKAYHKSFLDQLKNVDFSMKLEENGFIKDSRYFYVYEKVYDSEGDYIGVAFIAEEIKNDNSFVNLVKNLVNSVTMVALGLIVSMLLFLF